jgi:adenylate cyclase
MINKYVGDEIIGVWNYLHIKPQPDHAMLAVRAGLDMVARMDGMNERLRAADLPAVKYGIGINSGPAVVGQMGTRLRKQYDIIGDTVNTGARLCSAAGGGEIIIGQATWELIGNRLIVEETEPLKLKGKSEPLQTFSCLGIRTDVDANLGVPVPASGPA